MIFAASLFLRRRFFWLRFIKVGLYFSFLVVFLLICWLNIIQFRSWSEGELSQYLLPPNRTINYFLLYSFSRFFAPYLTSAVAALIFLYLSKFYNKKYKERFFNPEEPYFGVLAIFLIGHPGWLFYVIFLLFFYFLLSIFYFLFSRRLVRVPLYYLWLPSAIFVMIINNYWLSSLSIWQVLKF